MGKSQRDKGAREERMALEWWQQLGVKGRRTAASGAMRGYSGDLELKVLGGLDVECKSRKGGEGFKQLEGWLGDCDLLHLRRNGKEPLFVLPASAMARFVEAAVTLDSVTAPTQEQADEKERGE